MFFLFLGPDRLVDDNASSLVQPFATARNIDGRKTRVRSAQTRLELQELDYATH